MQSNSILKIELKLDDFIPKGDTRHYMGVDLMGLQLALQQEAGPFYDSSLSLMKNVAELIGQEFHDEIRAALTQHKHNLKTAYAIVEKVLTLPN